MGGKQGYLQRHHLDGQLLLARKNHSCAKPGARPAGASGGLGDETGGKRSQISASPDISAQDGALRHTASPAMLLW